MKILITGGAGFIASHIADAYIEAGHEVAIIDDLSSGKLANINPKAQFFEGSIADRSFVDHIFEGQHFDVVNHHAAQIDVRKSVADPAADAMINIVGSLNLFEAARKASVKHIVFASTGGAIYGEQDYFPADEEHPTRPESPYGTAKRAVEMYLGYYKTVYGLDHTIVRYSNVYGPRQDPHGEAGVVAIFCNALIDGKQVSIYGDGTQTRDYVYVGDLVRAHLAIIEHLDSSTIYNIATGIETDVNKLYEVLSKILSNGKATPQYPQYADARLGEQKRSVCNAAKAKKQLGWEPRVSLEIGLKETAEYFQKLSS